MNLKDFNINIEKTLDKKFIFDIMKVADKI